MSSYLYLFICYVLTLSVNSTPNKDKTLNLREVSNSNIDEDAIDSILIDELINNSSDSNREDQIRNAIEVFRKYDLWKKAYEIHSQIDGNNNKWKFVKTPNQAIRDTRKSNTRPNIVEVSDDITEQMKNNAINGVLNGFRKYDNLKSICSSLSGLFNKKYNKFWQCFIGLDSTQFDYAFWRNSHLVIKHDEIIIHLFRASVGIPSEFETLEQIRKEMPEIQTIDSEMLDSTKQEVINRTIEAIKAYNTFLDISTDLQQTFDKNHGKYWQSIVKHKSHPISSKFRFSAKLFIHITIGDLSVILYKSPTVTSHDVISSVKSSSSEAIVYVSEMNSTIENEVKKIAADGLNYHDEFEEIGKYVKSVSESRFGGYWNCIVGVKPHYDANAVSKATNSYIVFGFANGDDEIVITLFKSKIKNVIEAIVKARTGTPKVTETSLKDEMNSQLIEVSTQALTMFDDFDSITKFISRTFDNLHSPHWHCIIGFKTYFQGANKHNLFKNLSFAELQVEDLEILLFKS